MPAKCTIGEVTRSSLSFSPSAAVFLLQSALPTLLSLSPSMLGAARDDSGGVSSAAYMRLQVIARPDQLTCALGISAHDCSHARPCTATHLQMDRAHLAAAPCHTQTPM